MAEALAILGATSSALQVFTFAGKVISHAHEFLTTGNDTLRAYAKTERLAEDYEKLANVCSTENGIVTDEDVGSLRDKCREEAKELLALLGELKPTTDSRGTRRYSEALRLGTRATIKSKEIERHRGRLQELNAQLQTGLLVQVLRQMPSNRRSPTEKRERARELVNSASAIIDIIQSLEFDEILWRWRAIDPAYERTFAWALKEESVDLKRWLSKCEGFFWITGKAGSGKSTLMKYIGDQPETKDFLKEWSPEKPVITASFSFWYAGTELQKSISGLLRTLLHHVLEQCYDLVSVAFPDMLEKPREIDAEWTQEELQVAIHNLAENGTTGASGKKFCFFIDGLDEYHGNHRDLLKMLRDLSNIPGIKLCVSSRPWTTFRRAFEFRVPTLHVEELTRKDHHIFAGGRLRQACSDELLPEEESQLRDLAQDIVKRAEGVFLWVLLVVKCVEEGLGNRDPLPLLRQKVMTFPSDLEDFFQCMLNRVDPTYQRQTRQALKLAYLQAQHDPGRGTQNHGSFYSYWLIMQNSHGLATPDFAYTEAQTLHLAKWDHMARDTESFLSAVCKDLVYVSPGPATVHRKDTDRSVGFLHRSVYDFLSLERMQETLDENLPLHFEHTRLFRLLTLARLQIVLKSDQISRDVTRASLHSVESFALESLETIHPDLCYEFVKSFETVLFKYSHVNRPRPTPKKVSTRLSFGWRTLSCLVAFRRYPFAEAYCDSMGRNTKNLGAVLEAALGMSPVHRFGIEEVDFSFVKKMLDKFPNAKVEGEVWRTLMRQWLPFEADDMEIIEPDSIQEEAWDICKTLLERGQSLESLHPIQGVGVVPSEMTEGEGSFCKAQDIIMKKIRPEWLAAFPLTAPLVS